MFLRGAKAAGRLALNWGVLLAAIAAVLVVRQRAEAEARAPLPAPQVRLTPAETRQWRAFPRYAGSVPVLVYHGINSTGQALSLTPQLFARQMLALKVAGFHAITLAQYAAFTHGDRNLPAKPILLTFDDGRRDAYRAASNVLRGYGFHGTMFTFASWPMENPGFSLTWGELERMQRTGIWSVQEHGGSGHEYVTYDAKGDEGATYAFRRYLPSRSGEGGQLESFAAFTHRVTRDVLWGEREFARHIPGYRPLAFATPYGDYGQEQTNDNRIPGFVLPWLDSHFAVVFGGDYLDRVPGRSAEIPGRFSPQLSYRISVSQATQLPNLYCRLKDWATGTMLWEEYHCLRLGSSWGPVIGLGRGESSWHPPMRVGRREQQHSANP